jgi:hypothetical protein
VIVFSVTKEVRSVRRVLVAGLLVLTTLVLARDAPALDQGEPGSTPPWEDEGEPDLSDDLEARMEAEGQAEKKSSALSAKSSPTSGTEDDDFVVIDDDVNIPLPPAGTVELYQHRAPDVIQGGESYRPPTPREPVDSGASDLERVELIDPGIRVRNRRHRDVVDDRELSDGDLQDRDLSDRDLGDRNLQDRDLSDRDLSDRDLGDRRR